jgi:predicted phage tail protein
MLRDIRLYGALGRDFGRNHRLDVETPNEAIRALIVLFPPIRARLREGYWRVLVGAPHYDNAVPSLAMTLGALPLHIVPATAPRGGDGGGIGKIIAGVVLVGAALVFAPIGAIGFGAAMGAGAFGGAAFGMTYGSIALLGASMVLSGVAGMLSQSSPQQSAARPEEQTRPEDRPSFLFNGAVNNTQQGLPVPLIIGTHLTGSIVISGGLNAEDIAP